MLSTENFEKRPQCLQFYDFGAVYAANRWLSLIPQHYYKYNFLST